MPKTGNVSFKLFLAISFLMAGLFVQAQDPVANFTANNVSGCSTIKCDLSPINQPVIPTSWSWDFGNGQLSTLQNPRSSLYATGDIHGEIDSKKCFGIDDEIKTDYITVFPFPSPSFTASLTTACAPAPIQFTDHSTSPPGTSITSWHWDFGDGGTSTQQNPFIYLYEHGILHSYAANHEQQRV